MVKQRMFNRKLTIQLAVFAGLAFCPGILSPFSVAAEEETHEVKNGETVHSIAKKHGSNMEDILQINQLDRVGSIQLGQRLSLNKPKRHRSYQKNAQFIETIGESAFSIANENGLYASVLLAQAILESNYGQSALALAPHYNLFGIKGSYQGESVSVKTNEFLNGQWTKENDQFRSYPNYYSSLLDNARVLRRGNSWSSDYYRGAWKENTNHYTDATAWLENRYATDPNYADKLNDIIQRYNLTKYDTAAFNKVVETKSVAVEESSPSVSSSSSTYKVVRGDTLYSIAYRYGMTVNNLKQLNRMTDDRIRTGQNLTVKGSSLSSTTTVSNTHTVSAGDTLYNIADRYGMSVQQLKTINHKQSNRIVIGENISVGDGVNSSASGIHTVSTGDTLYNIANRYQTSVRSLKNKNNLTSNKIILGQKIYY